MDQLKSRSGNRLLASLPLLLLMFVTLLATGVALAQLPASDLSSEAAQGKIAAPAPATASPTATCTSGWTIYPNPAPAGDSVLNAITAISPSDLWAVGALTSTGTTLTVHGDGTNWTYVPNPTPPGGNAVLQGVAGVASNDVWAVGWYGGPARTLTEHWNGTAWSIVPSPNDTFGPDHLSAVVAVASNDVWAVGRVGDTDFPHIYALIEHWDGTAWSIVPNAGGCCGTPLYGVVALSANDVWAVGGGYPGGYGTYGTAYIEHWNGTAWSTVTNPASGGTSLRAVTAVAPNDIWAVGYGGGNYAGQTLIEHWDGTAWTIVPSPNPGATTNPLYGVSGHASNDVWAVGDTNQASGGVKTFALHWDGTAWFQQATPDDPAGRGYFYAVAANGATGGAVWAVGTSGCASGCNQNALIARAAPACLTPVPTWTPTATNTATPACGLDWRGVPNSIGSGWLEAVSAVPGNANDIWAVGAYYPNGYLQALIEHWNGTQWNIVPYDPSPGNPSFGFTVAAVASNDVWAVVTGGFIHWNGSSWTPVPSPSPGYQVGMTALATNNVWAVGYQEGSNQSTTLIKHWDGTQWSVVPSPNPAATYSDLYAVTAVAANNIWAVGRSYNGTDWLTLIEHWDGTQWNIVPSPSSGQLQSVSAVTANDIWAVGYSPGNGNGQTLTEHWNGTQWSIVPSPNPRPNENNQLMGVAALATNDVWAVGWSSPYTNPGETLIEHWNGTQWSAWPNPPGGQSFYGVTALAANNVWAVGGLTAHYNDPCIGSITPTRTPVRTTTATPTATCTVTGAPGPWATRANLPLMLTDIAVASDGANVYAFGGRNGSGRHSQAYKYDYAADSWTAIASFPYDAIGEAEAEYGHNGKIYVIWDNGTYIYDIATNSWSLGAATPQSELSFGHAYWNGKIYVIGGYITGPLNGVYAYDIATNSWSTLAPLPQAEGLVASAAINGKIYVANGQLVGGVTGNLYIYDIATNTWTEGPSSPLASAAPGSTVVDGKLYMIGGDPQTGSVTANTYLYDPVANSWSQGPSLNVARKGGDAAIINTPGGQTSIVVGGASGVDWLNSVEASTAPNVPCATATGAPPTATRTSTPVATATSCTQSGTWNIVPSPNEGVGDNLDAVTAISANDVWAVGWYGDGSAFHTLTEHWNGSNWSVVPSPENALLYGVSAVSTNDVWAVGGYDNGGGSVTLHWDGSSWSLVANPNQGPYSALYAVTAISSDDVWAVGEYNGGGGSSLALHWDGSSWTGLPTPVEGQGHNFLYGISAVAANDIWAVGYFWYFATEEWDLTLHWDGIQWNIVSNPNMGGRLQGVAAIASNDVWAVGDAETMHWNGSAWSIVPNPSPAQTYFRAVTAVSSNDVWAVGDYGSGSSLPESLHWDGSSWSVMPMANPGGRYNEPLGVAAVSANDVWAVGWYDDVNNGTEYTLAEHHTGGVCATVTATPPANTATPSTVSTSTRTPTLPPTQTPGGPTATPFSTDTAVPSTGTPRETVTPARTACTISFSDVPPGSTFYQYIHCLACLGLINGYPNGTFKPNNDVTRGQLSKIVANAAGFTDPQPTQMFQDVPVGSTFQVYIGRLASRGFISGYPCGQPGEQCVPPDNLPYFRPNANATRGQISKIVSNAAGFEDPPIGQQFQDVPVGSTYYTYTYRLVSRGVMSGYPCGSPPAGPCVPPANLPYFRPNNNATRGQTSKIVANTFFPDCVTPRR